MRLTHLLLALLILIPACQQKPPLIAQDALQDARNRLDDLLTNPTIEGSQTQPDAITEPAIPAITFGTIVSASPAGVQRQTVTVTERWLVSEPWCANCPAAKRAFLAAGNLADHVINIADAKRLHGKDISAVPAEYATKSVQEILQPPTYRKQWPPKWDVLGDRNPTRAKLLAHLRKHENHASKHWQAWHLESWTKEQLAALHDDDHEESVPTFDETPESIVTADITNLDPSTAAVLGAFTDALIHSSSETAEASAEEITYGSWFEFDANLPDMVPTIIATLMKDQEYHNDAMGISLSWSGERSFKLTSTSIVIQPAIKSTVKKFGITMSASVSEIKFSPDYRSVTVVTPERLVPDIQVNFK